MPSISFPRVLAGICAGAAAMTVTLAAPSHAAPTPDHAFSGYAYGSTVNIGSTVTSGKTSYLTMCATDPAYSRDSNTVGVDVPDLLSSVGVATTKVSSGTTPSSDFSLTTAHTGATSLLGGRISASAINSSARATDTAGSFSYAGTSELLGLSILGVPMSAYAAPNTTVVIPKIAKVVLNAQSVSASRQVITVTALRVTILPGNPLNLPVSTIVIGVSSASLRVAHALPYGSAYGTRLTAGVLSSGATAAVGLPCGGSPTEARNNLVGVNLPHVATTGVLQTSAKSTDSAGTISAATSASVTSVDLLDGVVTADAVSTKASASRTGSDLTRSSDGTVITNLKVNGKPVAAVAANSKIAIAGVGTLWVRKTSTSSTGITVYGLQLVVTATVGNLVPGAVLNVAVTSAGVRAS